MSIVKIKSKKHSEMIDITKDIESLLPENMEQGICHVFSLHTTAGITVNENADPDVCDDITKFMNKAIPWDDKEFKHMEGNSAAHIKTSFFGSFQAVPVQHGKLKLGTWQSIYFCEFDGPRDRKIDVKFIESID